MITFVCCDIWELLASISSPVFWPALCIFNSLCRFHYYLFGAVTAKLFIELMLLTWTAVMWT